MNFDKKKRIIAFLQRSFKDKENSTNHMESINIIIYEYYIYVYD